MRSVRHLSTRASAAARLGLAVSGASRRLGLGEGMVIGGRVTLFLQADALSRLSSGSSLALVSGTNGKTTTTRLLAGALAAAGPVVSNAGGANLPTGLVTALARAPRGARGSLEVDEAWLGAVAQSVRPACFVLLNLTRDQLDRVSEVRHLAARWRAAVEGAPRAAVVANADDPLVTWAASAGPDVTWVAAGQPWRADAVGCPSCDGRIRWRGEEWSCASGCGLARPAPDVWLEEDELVLADGGRLPMRLTLPGRFNRANAAMAAVAAQRLGVSLPDALAAMALLSGVAGRYEIVTVDAARSRRARLLLAKNPAGWVELFGLLAPEPAPLMLAINARLADGRDPSWLWDVPFEQLRGRFVVASGERWRDLAVRLHYADVDHQATPDLRGAVLRAGEGLPPGEVVDAVANYTAFQDMRTALRHSGGEPRSGWFRRVGADPRPVSGNPPPGRSVRAG